MLIREYLARTAWMGWTGRPRRPWGDGILDQSLSTAWYPGSVEDASDDELVLFIPSLARSPGPWQLWESRLVEAQVRLRDTAETELTTSEIMAFAAAVRLAGCSAVDNRTRGDGASAQMPVALQDAYVTSIQTRINAAYVLPEHAMHHELLSMGAWLGVLLDGRAALMPEFVAHRLVAVGTRKLPGDGLGRVTDDVIEQLGGMNRFMRTARKVLRTRQPVVMQP